MKKMNLFALVIAIALFCGLFMIGCKKQELKEGAAMNNEYPLHQIESYKKKTESSTVSIEQLKRVFPKTVIRETHQGQYAVIRVKGGLKAFAFFDTEGLMTCFMIRSKDFISKDIFLDLIKDSKTIGEIMEVDKDAILLPLSAVDATAHIVLDGLVIIKYSRASGEPDKSDYAISDVIYIRNDEIPTSEDPVIRDLIPFIFSEDK